MNLVFVSIYRKSTHVYIYIYIPFKLLNYEMKSKKREREKKKRKRMEMDRNTLLSVSHPISISVFGKHVLANLLYRWLGGSIATNAKCRRLS